MMNTRAACRLRPPILGAVADKEYEVDERAKADSGARHHECECGDGDHQDGDQQSGDPQSGDPDNEESQGGR